MLKPYETKLQSIKEEILKEVDNFREGYEQVDDITLLVVKI